ncbi:proliferating cell nuclear antigen [Mycoemilia scoparia]|uniref:DNA sliding clamp PCNA n=1 Tax=Mycoemilia scoparia TaxID=417184 RepID=A0A9W8A3D0_9FUNG|nr:proliferating cell nuclear antigen [Mycoemilia scoparia]
MLEARLPQAALLKKIVEALKEMVNESNFDCGDSGISMQAMDSAHIAMCSLLLRSEGFEPYRCDRVISLGLSFSSLSKVLKCAGNDDVVTLKAEDDADTLGLMFESPKEERVSQFDLKLMDIDSDHVSIPDQEYDCTVHLSSAEFARICRDLSTFGASVVLDATKEGIKFSASGELGRGGILLKQQGSVDDSSPTSTRIEMREPVSVTLSLKYLNIFTKAAPLSEVVTINMSSEIPVLFQFSIGDIGHIRFYLAPQIQEDD